MGRRRTHKDATRTKLVSVRLRSEAYDRLTAHAEKLGVSRASYLEHLVENKTVNVEVSTSEMLPVPVMNELKRIGNNLNQIAHQCNLGLWTDTRATLMETRKVIDVMCSNEHIKRRYETAKAALKESGWHPYEDAHAKEMEKVAKLRAEADKARAYAQQLASIAGTHDPKASSARPKFPWSLFVRSPRR